MAVREGKGFLPDINITNTPHRKSTRLRSQRNDATSLCSENMEDTDFTELFQAPFHQTVCVSMLQEGFFRSFEELFSLLQRARASRMAAVPDSPLWQQPLLEEEPEKLEMLKTHLTAAEGAQRCGVHEVDTYEHYLELARFFTAPEDIWLRQRFYQLSLETIHKITWNFDRRKADANEYMAQVYLDQDNLELAQRHYEMFYRLVNNQSWQEEDKEQYQLRACEALCGVYKLLGERHVKSQDHRTAVNLFNKAYKLAKDAGDQKMEGDVAYRVGLSYQALGKQKFAKQFLNRFITIETALDNTENVGKGYRAMAKSLEIEGKLHESIEYLQLYAEISQRNQQNLNLQDAYMCLGSIYSLLGDYTRSREYFSQAYEITCDQGSAALLEKSQLCLGISKAHEMLKLYSSHMDASGRQSLATLIRWKETREDVFSQPAQDDKRASVVMEGCEEGEGVEVNTNVTASN